MIGREIRGDCDGRPGRDVVCGVDLVALFYNGLRSLGLLAGCLSASTKVAAKFGERVLFVANYSTITRH